MSVLPYGRQDIASEDIAAVVEVLKSEFLTQGPMVPRFEEQIAEYCGSRHAIAVNSATSALHIACLALGLKEGGLLWTSPNTFVASANCARYCGADVDFVDIDPLTFNMSVDALANKLKQAQVFGRLPDLVVPVHFAGQSCEMKAIWALSRTYGFKVIEDASHAIGGVYCGSRIGSCRYSDITVFSFHPVKIITTAEGGMALTNSAEIAERMGLFRSHGITRDPSRMTRASDGPWYYEQASLGFNYRLTDVQAALGLSQLTRIERYVEGRNEIARRYDRMLAGVPLKVPSRSSSDRSALHLYVVRIASMPGQDNRKRVFELLRKAGIGVNVHYIPVYRQPYYERIGYPVSGFPEMEHYYSEAISLPIFATLTEGQQLMVVNSLASALDA